MLYSKLLHAMIECVFEFDWYIEGLRPCDEKGKARAFVDNRKDRRKKKQRSSKNKNTRRYSSLAGKKHCGDVCGCKRSQKVEGHDRLRLQQTRQLMMMMIEGLHCLTL